MKVMWILLFLITLFSVVSMIWWVLGTTSGFNRGLAFDEQIHLFILFLPLLILTILAIVYLVNIISKPDANIRVAIFIILCTPMILVSQFLIRSPRISVTELFEGVVHSDTLRVTEDGMYRYRIDLINAGQRNADARLFVIEVATNKEILIPLVIDVSRLNGFTSASTPSRRRGRGVGFSIPDGDNINFLWGRLSFNNELNGHTLAIPAGEAFQVTYINDDAFEFWGFRVGREDIKAIIKIDIDMGVATCISDYLYTENNPES